MRRLLLAFPILLLIVWTATSLPGYAQNRRTRDWLTWGGDPERSGWARGESSLSRSSVRRLELKWKAQIDRNVGIDVESGAAMLTTPLVVDNVRTSQGSKTVVLTLAASNTMSRLDLATGNNVWQRKFENAVEPLTPANWICTNTSTATPVVDRQRGIVYLIASDGRLHGVALQTGNEELTPVEFVPPYSRNWSLNLVNGVL